MAEPVHTPAPAAPNTAAPRTGNSVVAAIAAWLIPGLGHVFLKRWRRGLVFLLLVLVSLWVGCQLQGNLYRPVQGQPLSSLATIGAMGMGLPYFLLRWGLGYEGNVMGAGYEYGTAFLLTAGLMNWLLILDTLDIARGRKE